MAEVKLEHVRKAYGKKVVYKDLNLTINDGECFTLLGPSGCGKTVMLRMIAGFESPDAGVISIGGEVQSSPADKIMVPPEERNLGVVFQDYAVWPHMTVRENVMYPLQMQKVDKAEGGEEDAGRDKQRQPERPRGTSAVSALGADSSSASRSPVRSSQSRR